MGGRRTLASEVEFIPGGSQFEPSGVLFAAVTPKRLDAGGRNRDRPGRPVSFGDAEGAARLEGLINPQ